MLTEDSRSFDEDMALDWIDAVCSIDFCSLKLFDLLWLFGQEQELDVKEFSLLLSLTSIRNLVRSF